MKRTLKNKKIKFKILKTFLKLAKSNFKKTRQRFVKLSNFSAIRRYYNKRITKTKLKTKLKTKTKSNLLNI